MAAVRQSWRSPAGRAQLALLASLLVLAAVAWVVTDARMQAMDSSGEDHGAMHGSQMQGGGMKDDGMQGMSGMSGDETGSGLSGDLGSLGFFTGVWVVMMAAMMLPSTAPMVITYAGLAERRGASGRDAPRGATAVFVAAYLVAWTAFGLLAYGLIRLVEALGGDLGGPRTAAVVLAGAAVYQLTPAKDACLRRCRTPMGFLTQAWQGGRSGAFRMGARHGAWCIGCCWALMAALIALGAMHIVWMILFAVIVAAEKLLPWPLAPGRVIAAVLLALAPASYLGWLA